MTTLEEIDGVPTKELHDRAFRLAEKRLDVGFFWKIFRAIPQAEAIWATRCGPSTSSTCSSTRRTEPSSTGTVR